MSISKLSIWPGWRSLLFVPAGNQRMVDKAATRGADALILDLEDAIPANQKAAARATVPAAIASLTHLGADMLVRVNAGTLDMFHDLEASVCEELRAVIIPKAEQPAQITVVDDLLTDLETATGINGKHIGIIALVETASGLQAAAALANASNRLMALALGTEDLALDLGGEPEQTLLTQPAARLVWAARAAGKVALGYPGPISNFADESRMRADMTTGKKLGLAGALCIHPLQIGACHQTFSVTEEQADRAQRVISAYAEAEKNGSGVCIVDQQMIDKPVAQRAYATLARWRKQRGTDNSSH